MARVMEEAARRFVMVVAWLFFLTTILGVLVTAIVAARSDDGTRTTFLYLKHHVGLTYAGLPGLVLAFGEAEAVSTCLVLSLSRHTARRRAGHIGLLAWASLILGNALCSFDASDAVMIVMVVTTAAIWMCVILRARWGWSSPEAQRG